MLNRLYLSWETPEYLKQFKAIIGIFSEHIIFANLECLEIHIFVNFGKGGHRQMMKSRLKTSWKSWIWDQYLPENNLKSEGVLVKQPISSRGSRDANLHGIWALKTANSR